MMRYGMQLIEMELWDTRCSKGLSYLWMRDGDFAFFEISVVQLCEFGSGGNYVVDAFTVDCAESAMSESASPVAHFCCRSA
jgi:hypothetical protein